MKTRTASDSLPVTLTVRCRAFTGEPLQANEIRVTEDAVLVWDSVAGHFTRCHALTPTALLRIRRMARCAGAR